MRSVDIAHLSDKDLRLTLLSHFDKPVVVDEETAEDLINQCESGFEREVFTALASRGYRVIPQVKTGAYRIDMVVEGADDTRLAIECDGAEYHGPDRWAHDMSRQRVLERARWVFWRCFASTWSLRKDDIMAELLSRLSAMGIEPLGAVSQMPSLVEKRVWVKQTTKEDGEDDVQAVIEKAISATGPAASTPSARVQALAVESAQAPMTVTNDLFSSDWIVKNVRFPQGTDFRAFYKGQTHTARVEGGALMLANGERFDSPSAAAISITDNSVNGWIFWECRLPGKSSWQRIDALRG